MIGNWHMVCYRKFKQSMRVHSFHSQFQSVFCTIFFLVLLFCKCAQSHKLMGLPQYKCSLFLSNLIYVEKKSERTNELSMLHSYQTIAFQLFCSTNQLLCEIFHNDFISFFFFYKKNLLYAIRFTNNVIAPIL